MAHPRSAARGALLGALLGALMLTAGCSSDGDRSAGRSAAPPDGGHGPVLLDVDECGSRGHNARETLCTRAEAVARVIARYDGRPADGPLCPLTTDFVLRISPSHRAGGGYACMRNLEPPHPGDPGGGGGPHTVVGDCVHRTGDGRVKETACDGSGAYEPEYTIGSAHPDRARCPAGTALYIRLTGESPVGCARRV
ncbi:hypothetical protein GCM10010232_13260 [Streptomyces amakusaensis]